MSDNIKTDEVIITDTIPEEDEIIIEDDEVLGRYVSHHPVNRLRLMLQVGFVYFVVTTALQFLFVNLDDQLASIVLIFLFAVVALGLAWYILHLWNREVLVYVHGFTYREGSVIADFNYDEVKSFRQKADRLAYFGGLIRRNVFMFTIRTIRDEVIQVTNLYTDIEQLGINLEHGINQVLRPTIHRRLAQGDAVPFADELTISEAGIHNDERQLLWADFAGFRTKGGALTLSSTDEDVWYQVPLHEVDNLTLIIELLRQQQPKPDAT